MLKTRLLLSKLGILINIKMLVLRVKNKNLYLQYNNQLFLYQ